MPATVLATTSQIPSRVGFKNILIATDYSAYSTKALQYGLAIARSYHSKVHLVHIVSSLGFAMAGPEAVSTALHLGLQEAVEFRQKLEAAGCLEGVATELHVEYGTDVAKRILEIICKQKPDLIVLGTHGRTGFRKIWLGSVAEEVFRSSPCPVLTVGPSAELPAAAGQPALVLFPTDFSPESLKALHGCIRFVEAKGSRLLLLHVAPNLHGEAGADKERVATALQEKLRELIPASHAGHAEVRVEFGDVQSTICAVANQERCSLIVMGLHHDHTLLEGRWKHAYGVVTAATCPVLTVRAVAHSRGR